MKLFHKHQKEERNKLQDKAPSHELSKFDKAKKEYLDMYEGCEDDTFSVKINYVSGAISLLKNMRQKDLIWFLTCCKEKIGSATYWNSKHNADLLVDFGYVTFIEVSKEDFCKRLVEFWSRWAEYNPFGDKPMPTYPSPFE